MVDLSNEFLSFVTELLGTWTNRPFKNGARWLFARPNQERLDETQKATVTTYGYLKMATVNSYFFR